MDEKIEEAIKAFRSVFFDGVPVMLRQNETAFLSFLCVCAATDALSGYRYQDEGPGTDRRRFTRFIREYFPPAYSIHAENLYTFRCRALHNFSPAKFTVVHGEPEKHFASTRICDFYLDDGTFFNDMRAAAEKLFEEVRTCPDVAGRMLLRLEASDRGGAIYIAGLPGT